MPCKNLTITVEGRLRPRGILMAVRLLCALGFARGAFWLLGRARLESRCPAGDGRWMVVDFAARRRLRDLQNREADIMEREREKQLIIPRGEGRRLLDKAQALLDRRADRDAE